MWPRLSKALQKDAKMRPFFQGFAKGRKNASIFPRLCKRTQKCVNFSKALQKDAKMRQFFPRLCKRMRPFFWRKNVSLFLTQRCFPFFDAKMRPFFDAKIASNWIRTPLYLSTKVQMINNYHQLWHPYWIWGKTKILFLLWDIIALYQRWKKDTNINI